MKIAVSGKGGVGKTTVSAFLSMWLADQGHRVLAIDADPDSNLGAALGVPNAGDILPLAHMKDLIAERTGATPGAFGGFFKMNPKVDDLPEKIAVPVRDNLKLLVMGGVKKGGGGCVCPENVMLKNLVVHLILGRDEVIIMDMEAGVEHLGRATSSGVDLLLLVVEPGRRSIDTALRIKELAEDINLKRLGVVANKIRNEEDRKFIKEALQGFEIIGFLPYDPKIIEADLKGIFAEDVGAETRSSLEAIGKYCLNLSGKQ